MNANDFASGSVGAVIVVLAWLWNHSRLITGILNRLPNVIADLEKLKNNPTGDVMSALERVAAKLEAATSPMAEPLSPSTPTTLAQPSVSAPEGPAPATAPSPTLPQ